MVREEHGLEEKIEQEIKTEIKNAEKNIERDMDRQVSGAEEMMLAFSVVGAVVLMSWLYTRRLAANKRLQLAAQGGGAYGERGGRWAAPGPPETSGPPVIMAQAGSGLSEEEEVRDLATWTVLQNDDPNHLGLRCNAFPGHHMALITPGCVPFSAWRPGRASCSSHTSGTSSPWRGCHSAGHPRSL